jgi:hypothetical protein
LRFAIVSEIKNENDLEPSLPSFSFPSIKIENVDIVSVIDVEPRIDVVSSGMLPQYWVLPHEQQQIVSNILLRTVQKCSNPIVGAKEQFAECDLLPALRLISNQDIARLRKNKWLSGILLTVFLQLITIQTFCDAVSCIAFNTEFYTELTKERGNVANYTKKLSSDYLSKRLVTIIHLPSHWICVIFDPAIADGGKKTLYILDSFKRKHENVALKLLHWRKSEWIRFHQAPSEQWEVKFSEVGDNLRLPLQTDSSSCGVLAGMNAYHYLRFGVLPTVGDFTEGDVLSLRLFMLSELLRLAKDSQLSLSSLTDASSDDDGDKCVMDLCVD